MGEAGQGLPLPHACKSGLRCGLTPANTRTSITLTLCDAAKARCTGNHSVLITKRAPGRSPHRPNNKQCV
jgi:hypothetical protein